MDILQHINDTVNKSFAYDADAPKWMTPEEARARGKGDCTSFAVAKYRELRANHIPARIIYVQSNQGPHVVVETNGMILDNIDDRILPKEQRKDLTPAFEFDDAGVYLRGRAVDRATLGDWWAQVQRALGVKTQ
jgi:predicted transglutaminase-like cysteine proteinase